MPRTKDPQMVIATRYDNFVRTKQYIITMPVLEVAEIRRKMAELILREYFGFKPADNDSYIRREKDLAERIDLTDFTVIGHRGKGREILGRMFLWESRADSPDWMLSCQPFVTTAFVITIPDTVPLRW